jgi:acyl-coenzyme A thioesterase 9
MHPQQKNVHNKVFGGYLMRMAYELAWSSGLLFSQGQRPGLVPLSLLELLSMDDTTFLAPVSLGDVVSFDSGSVLH